MQPIRALDQESVVDSILRPVPSSWWPGEVTFLPGLPLLTGHRGHGGAQSTAPLCAQPSYTCPEATGSWASWTQPSALELGQAVPGEGEGRSFAVTVHSRAHTAQHCPARQGSDWALYFQYPLFQQQQPCAVATLIHQVLQMWKLSFITQFINSRTRTWQQVCLT